MASVNVQFKGDMLFEAKSGNHTLKVDVPSVMGGKDRGMQPTELLATSLASCVSVLVVAYCRDMKIDATGLSVELTYDKLDQPTRLGHFKVAIKIPGERLGIAQGRHPARRGRAARSTRRSAIMKRPRSR